MDPAYIAIARAFWDAGKPLDAGRVLVETIPKSARVRWAGELLEVHCGDLRDVPSEVTAVVMLSKDRGRWSGGKLVFSGVRRLTLRMERGAYPATDKLQGVLFMAENTAKVAYNATDPEDPFDEDSACWVVENIHWIAERVATKEGKVAAWNLLSSVSQRVAGEGP